MMKTEQKNPIKLTLQNLNRQTVFSDLLNFFRLNVKFVKSFHTLTHNTHRHTFHTLVADNYGTKLRHCQRTHLL